MAPIVKFKPQRSLTVAEEKEGETYTLSSGSTGSSTTGLSATSSLSFLARGAGKSLNSSGALRKKEKRKKGSRYIFFSSCISSCVLISHRILNPCIPETYSLSLGTGLSLRTRVAMVTLLAETHTHTFH